MQRIKTLYGSKNAIVRRPCCCGHVMPCRFHALCFNLPRGMSLCCSSCPSALIVFICPWLPSKGRVFRPLAQNTAHAFPRSTHWRKPADIFHALKNVRSCFHRASCGCPKLEDVLSLRRYLTTWQPDNRLTERIVLSGLKSWHDKRDTPLRALGKLSGCPLCN